MGSSIRPLPVHKRGLHGKWPLPFAAPRVGLTQMQRQGAAEPCPRQGTDWPGEDTAGMLHR